MPPSAGSVVLAALEGEFPEEDQVVAIKEHLRATEKKVMRRQILDNGKRIDGRGVFAVRDGKITHRQERQRRVALANRVLAHYRLSLGDFAGQQYVLRTPTGRARRSTRASGTTRAAISTT